MKFLLLCVLVAQVCLMSVQGAQPCDSKSWCESRETAARCGVLDQCNNSTWTKEAKKVDLVVYYESFCPDCTRIIQKQLLPNYGNLSSIMNLTLVPYGKATERKEGDQWVFECQHGPNECLGNVIMTCAIDIVKDIPKYLPFINCLGLTYGRPNPKHAAIMCYFDTHVPIDDILDCAKSKRGNELEHQMALLTKALQPPMRFVPHCTVNGEHTEELEKQAETDLVKLICDTYEGVKPPVCK